MARKALADDEIGGQKIRAGATVIVSPWILQRHTLWWDDPDAFDPDRFAPGVTRDRFAFLPFGAGPRICIGASFALQEAVIILATLVARLRFDLTARQPQPRMILTLRPHGGLWLSVRARA